MCVRISIVFLFATHVWLTAVENIHNIWKKSVIISLSVFSQFSQLWWANFKVVHHHSSPPPPRFFFNPFGTKLMFPGCTGFQGLLYKKIYSWVWKYSKVSTKEFSTVRQTCNREVSCHTKWQDVRKEVKYWQDWCCHMEEESKKLQEIAKNKRTCHEMLRTLLEDKRSS